MELVNIFIFIFLKLGFTPCNAGQPLEGMELQEKESQKCSSIQEICLERSKSEKMSACSRLKATQIIGQKKAFYRQRIPEPS